MRGITLCALMLCSNNAFATDTRAAALSNNAGLADDTDYEIFASQADEVGENVWLDYDGATLSGAFAFDGKVVSIDQGATATSFGWVNSSGDTGYSASLEVAETDVMALGGSYSMSDGDRDMAFGGGLSLDGDVIGVGAGFYSRELSSEDVTAYGGGVTYLDGSIGAAGSYLMGWVRGADASNAALTVGPGLSVWMPDGGDMVLSLSLLSANLAGEFMFNDWLGIRGSVTGGLDVVDLTGDLSMASTLGAAMGGTFHCDAGDIDILIDPGQLLGGPFFLTGAGTGAALALSARFDI